MRDWTKNLGRAAVVAAGAVAFASGAGVGLAAPQSAGGGSALLGGRQITAPVTSTYLAGEASGALRMAAPRAGAADKLDLAGRANGVISQSQWSGSGAALHKCGDWAGSLAKGNIACSWLKDGDDEDEHGVGTLGEGLGGPADVDGDAQATVNIIQSGGYEDKDSCDRCDDSYDEYDKPYKAKPYKAKKYKAKKYKAKGKASKSKSYKSYKGKGKKHRPKGYGWRTPMQGPWYMDHGGPLPSTKRMATVPGPEYLARYGARPQTRPGVQTQPKEQGRIRSFLGKLVQPLAGLRVAPNGSGDGQVQEQAIGLEGKGALKLRAAKR